MSTQSLTKLSPEKLEQLKNDIKAAGYILEKVTPRTWDTLIEVTSRSTIDRTDRSNILAIIKASSLRCSTTTLIGTKPRKSIVVAIEYVT